MARRVGERGRRDDGLVLKKGPWTAEEDEVLMGYVSKYGPRDWSSVRSKGLLPRSGKSCRLRWVNKLKPDLKTGCKFSAEEERIVIELQARFGNKWARIATYLQGRTDNDVKNFWSTRQKRLARLLQSASQKKPQKHNYEKTPLYAEAPIPEPSANGFFPYGEEYPNGDCSKVCETRESTSSDLDMLELQEQDASPNLKQALPPLELEFDRKPCLLESQLPQFYFPQLPEELLDLPLLPEGHELRLGLEDLSLETSFTEQDSMECDIFSDGLPFLGLEGSCNHRCNAKMEDGIPNTPESFFDDFPVDMLDCSDPLPPSSSSGV